MSRFVIAGANGHVGSAAASDLLAKGQAVRVIVRDPKQGAEWSRRKADVMVGSLDDVEFMARAVDGARGFLAMLPEDPAIADFHGHRRRMADAMGSSVRKTGVPHVVIVSAIAASRPDRNGPGKDLHYLEGLLRESGATLTANRGCYYQENVASAIGPARAMGIYPNLMASSDAPIPTIATRDVGMFAAQALMNPPDRSEVVDLTGPAYSVEQMAEKLGETLELKLRVVEVPPAAQVAALTQAGLPPAFAEAVAELMAAFAARLITPLGDRTLTGTTALDDILPGLISATSRA